VREAGLEPARIAPQRSQRCVSPRFHHSRIGADRRDRTCTALAGHWCLRPVRLPFRQTRIWWRRPGSNRRPPGCGPGVLPLHHVSVLVGLVGVEPIVGRVSDGCTCTVVLQPSGGPGRTRTAIGRVQAGCSPFELQARMMYPAGVEPACSAMSARRVQPLRYGYDLAPEGELNQDPPLTRRLLDRRATPARMATWTGVEPALPCSTDRYVNHYTTRSRGIARRTRTRTSHVRSVLLFR
jgi:hypothetical protein